MVAFEEMTAGSWLTSTRQPADVRIFSHRSPGRSLVTTTRCLPPSLKTYQSIMGEVNLVGQGPEGAPSTKAVPKPRKTGVLEGLFISHRK